MNKDTLEQAPCEDAISRQAAIEAVKKNTFRLKFAEEQGNEGYVAWSAKAVYSDAIEGALLELPPVNPQPCEDAMTKGELLKEIDRERKWLDNAGYTSYNIDIVFSSLYKSVKALEQEPKTDTWNIKEVADALERHGLLEQGPKTGHWIPVSERLPKIAGIYRVTRYYPNNVMNPNYLVDACCFDGSNTWYDDNRINYDRAYADNVIAWQENPEPYKVEPQESEDKTK